MITPMDIHNKTFSRQLRGYSQEEVNAFLEELASDYEKIYREHREAEEEMDTIRTKLRNYEKMEATMSSTLVMAQETAENVKRAAQNLNLYIEKILSNFKSAFSLVEACKFTPAPEIIEEPETAPHDDDLYAEELSSKAEEIEETTENKEESNE